jgi:cytochrome c-type biogenesis protein CcmE
MDPARKRMIRFSVALTAAVLLASALIYTSFSASSEARTPSQLASSTDTSKTFQLTGKVVPGYTRDGLVTKFRVRDRDGTVSVPVTYHGVLPDPFRAGREVIIDVRHAGGVWVGQPDSLITKCPSKFSESEQKT